MNSLCGFSSAPSVKAALAGKGGSGSGSVSASSAASSSGSLLSPPRASTAALTVALDTSALVPTSPSRAHEYGLISPNSLFRPWAGLAATTNISLTPFSKPAVRSALRPPVAIPKPLPSHKVIPPLSSDPKAIANSNNKRPVSSVISLSSSSLRPPPTIRSSRGDTGSRVTGGNVPTVVKRNTRDTMSTHGQNNNNSSSNIQDDKSRFASSSCFPEIPRILPHEKVFPIQIGGELFRLSGASISSDAPSYFSQFFEQQLAALEGGQTVRTLYIDRDPVTFRDIARHLQGYHVSPKDGQHFVQLFADAQFYSLPKLISQLFESEIFISIGSRPFQINRDLFQSPGNNPNYFSLGFAVFFSSPSEVFPGLSREGLLRPPSILPPEVPTRSGEVFAELLHLLRGYPIHIRNEEHRQGLLRDCRYFHLKGLEQKLISHEISWNQKRQRPEIVIRLEDIKPSGVSFVPDVEHMPGRSTAGWINYARPFVDEPPRELVLEVGNEQTKVDWRLGKAEFSGKTDQRISALLQVIANKIRPPVGQERPPGPALAQSGMDGSTSGSTPGSASPGNTPLGGDKVKVNIGPDCFVQLDGEEWWDREGSSPPDGYELDSDEPYSTSRHGPGSDAGRNVGGSGGGMSPSFGGWQQQPGLGSRPPSTKPQGPLTGAHPRKRQKRMAVADDVTEWIVKRGQWRIRVHSMQNPDGRERLEVVLVGVKLDAYTGEYGRNGQRKFLI